MTTIIDATEDKEGLLNWIAWKGEHAANTIRDNAGYRGTLMHEHIENYFNEGIIPEFTSMHDICIVQPYWDCILPFLPAIEKPIIQEARVWHDEGFAGTLDSLAYPNTNEYDFKKIIDPTQPSLWDWKSADKPMKPVKIYRYALQLAAYWAASNFVYKTNGLDLSHAVLACAIDGYKFPQVIEFGLEELKQYYEHFLARLQQYAFSR